MFDYQIQDMYDRLKPGSPHHDAVKANMDRIVGTIPDASATRREIFNDPWISGAERKRRLDEMKDGALRQRIDESIANIQAVRAPIDAQIQSRLPHRYVSPAEQAALDNLSLVDAVAYFAKRALNDGH